ncbi:recombination mediator RecR [Patescibacteria group bacterium]|nr:recombination mediator RecR [Patescibacteria group bacterium]MBU1922574.1 recombination mediator RecR [Patescibacteria group bacterium]
MNNLPEPIHNLVSWFNKLPGIGPKTSLRFVYYLLKTPKHELEQFAQSLRELHEKITFCSLCQTHTLKDPCSICANEKRDKSALCVVSEPRDMQAIENTGEYNGLYFVLGGLIQPIEGITPDKLRFKELEQRMNQSPAPKEIIFAFNPDIDGETTTLHLSKILKKYPIKITKLARGLPVGAELEYADQVTLTDALKGRREV